MIKILILPFPTVLIFSNDAIVCWDCLLHSFSLSPSKYSVPILADLWKGGKEEEWRRKGRGGKEGNKEEQRRRGGGRGGGREVNIPGQKLPTTDEPTLFPPARSLSYKHPGCHWMQTQEYQAAASSVAAAALLQGPVPQGKGGCQCVCTGSLAPGRRR